MEEAKVRIRLQLGYIGSPKKDKNYPILFVWTNEK